MSVKVQCPAHEGILFVMLRDYDLRDNNSYILFDKFCIGIYIISRAS